ncbi:DODA-type extradiol aromatic ring-opening family dioxygenase [Stappia sediminis]|uniref:DODA-type extradiol aromatic ring-opening family dioxygenase n=1 Tax=Stappia sediminis TaxID=2692190 RepID=UPI0019252EB4|nr:class III extradiol ring-cleavage dioxygenase [Stappia sediminis]
MPALFVSHGAPDLAVLDTPERGFLEGLAADLPRPRAIVSVSAHFETTRPAVVADPAPETIYDFGNFDPRLFEIVYPAPGDPQLAQRIATGMREQGQAVDVLEQRGFDHGTWVPLTLVYPQADIPVVQLSVQPREGPEHHLRIGRMLRDILSDDVLLFASGALTHNLRELFSGGMPALDAPAPDWVNDFGDWVGDRVAAGDEAALLDYRARAPHAARNHPTDEHLLPIFVAMGFAGEGWNGRRLFAGHSRGLIRMDTFSFQ